MSWFKGTKESNADQTTYPEKCYRQSMCNRKHCTDSCTNNTDSYKFWALFLCDEQFNQKDLIDKINLVPFKMRMIVYTKFSGNLKTVDDYAYNFYLKEVNKKNLGKIKNKDKNNENVKEAEYIKRTIQKDKQLVLKIFKLCKKYKYMHENNIFNIYKKLSKNFNLNHSVLNLIFNLIILPGATKDNVYTILFYCFGPLGLSDYFEPEEKIILEDTNTAKSNEDFTDAALEQNIIANKSYTNLFDQNSEAIIVKPEIKQDDLDKSKITQILELIFEQEFETFLTILDIAFVYNITFKEVIQQASKFSEITTPDTLLKVLGARANMKYYKTTDEKIKNDGFEQHEMSYFDFLIVLNETAKAQENLKEQYENEIAKLKHNKTAK